jgi:hypothetical protein
MSRRDRKVKLELTVPQAVALYYAAGSLRTTSYTPRIRPGTIRR